MSNERNLTDQPLVGCGLVIYDNWCEELRRDFVVITVQKRDSPQDPALIGKTCGQNGIRVFPGNDDYGISALYVVSRHPDEIFLGEVRAGMNLAGQSVCPKAAFPVVVRPPRIAEADAGKRGKRGSRSRCFEKAKT